MIDWPCARFINGDNRLLGELQDPDVQKHQMYLGRNHTFVKVPVNPKKYTSVLRSSSSSSAPGAYMKRVMLRTFENLVGLTAHKYTGIIL